MNNEKSLFEIVMDEIQTLKEHIERVEKEYGLSDVYKNDSSVEK